MARRRQASGAAALPTSVVYLATITDRRPTVAQPRIQPCWLLTFARHFICWVKKSGRRVDPSPTIRQQRSSWTKWLTSWLTGALTATTEICLS